MDEDPFSSVREPASTPVESESIFGNGASTTNIDRNKHLDSIAECFRFTYERLPPEVQLTYEPFLTQKDYDAFYKCLEQSIQNQCLLVGFLSGDPEFRLAIVKLFGDKYPSVRSFYGGDRKTSHHQTVSFAQAPSPLGVQPERPKTSGKPQGSLKYFQRASGTQAKQRRQSSSRNYKPFPATLTLTGSREGTPRHNSQDIPTIISPSSEGSSDQSEPDFVILGDLPQDRQMNCPNPNGQAAIAGGSGTSHGESVNLTARNKKRLGPPEIELNRAKIFLRDNDIDKTPDWGPKFKEILNYCLQLIPQTKGVARGAPWVKDLEDVMAMLKTHELFEQYHYGPRKLVLDFPNPFPAVSKRLPPISDFTIDTEPDPQDWVLDDRELIRKGTKPVHDIQYSLTRSLPSFLKAYEFDVRELWDHASNRPHRRREAQYRDPADQLFNVARAENENFDYCIYRGMRMSSSMMKSERGFQDADKTLPSHEHDEPHVNDLRTWSKFRGARRAALQQCLNMFDNMENRIVCSPWRTMVLPQHEETGMFVPWDTPVFKDPPKQETHDPFGYALAHRWYLEEERTWAKWARPHAIKEAYGHKRWMHREEPIMDLPHNFKGPYVHHDMDKDMKKVHDTLLRYKVLSQRLTRANLKSPRRPFDAAVNCTLKGLQGISYKDLNLQFREDEFRAEEDLMPIRPMEEDWLNYLGSASVNEPIIQSFLSPPKMEHLAMVFEVRVVTMLNDVSPKALFRDTKVITLDEFMEELNRCVEGPVKRHAFTREEAIRYGHILAQKGELKMSTDASGEATISRPVMTIHPEDRIRWPLPTRLARERPGEKQMRPEQQLDSISRGEYNSDAMSTSTISTKVSVPESEIYEHPDGMPHLDHLSDWDLALQLRDGPKMYNFICCLCYRFGKTMYDLKQKYKNHQATLTQAQRNSNREFLATIVRYWENDVARRPNLPEKNPAAAKDRVTPAYRDIVRMAEPEKFKKEWEDPVHDISAAETESWHLTRTGLIREAYENKNLLLPTRVIKMEGPGGLVWDIRTREPIWSFAHPHRRGPAPRFWDLNRWPLHLQLERTQAEIRASGPKRDECIVSASLGAERWLPEHIPQPAGTAEPQVKEVAPAKPPRQDPVETPQNIEMPQFSPAVGVSRLRPGATQDWAGDTLIQDPVESPQNIEVPYFNPDVGRRKFKPGVTQYWAGDTPYQRKVIEDRIKSRLEPKPNKRSWWEAFVPKRRKLSDPFPLPKIDPRDIPKSKPREPTPESLERAQGVSASEGEDAPGSRIRVEGEVVPQRENVSQGDNSHQREDISRGNGSSKEGYASQIENSFKESVAVTDDEMDKYPGKSATPSGITNGQDEDDSGSDGEVEDEEDSLVQLSTPIPAQAPHTPQGPMHQVQHTRIMHGESVAEPLNLRIPASSNKKRRKVVR